MAKKLCQWCFAERPPERYRYCSDACSNAARQARMEKKNPKKYRERKKLHSADWQSRARALRRAYAKGGGDPLCRGCDTPLPSKSLAMYCSDDCRRAAHDHRVKG